MEHTFITMNCKDLLYEYQLNAMNSGEDRAVGLEPDPEETEISLAMEKEILFRMKKGHEDVDGS